MSKNSTPHESAGLPVLSESSQSSGLSEESHGGTVEAVIGSGGDPLLPLFEGQESMSALSAQLDEVARALRGFDALIATSHGERFEQLKRRNLSLIEGKLKVELEASLQLPLFVSVIGGANTGKSTLFNALAGEMLATTTITSGSTLHPLIYTHERWREAVMSGLMFPRPAPLSGPGDQLVDVSAERSAEETGDLKESAGDERVMGGALSAAPDASELDFKTFVSLHQRAELENVALIDTPNLDSYDRRGAQVSETIMDRADLCVFVTTPQKYKDAALIEALRRQLDDAREVFVLFNFTDDAITYRTMASDLKRALPSARLTVGGALRAESSAEPERALSQEATEALRTFLTERNPQEIKRALITHQLREVIASSQEMVTEYRDQTTRREELISELKQHVDSALYAYRDQFSLPFPELGEALSIQISQIELRRIFNPKSSPEQSPRWGVFFAHGFGLAGEKLRGFFVKSFKLGAPPANWETFWRQRDEQDLANLRHHAQLLRASIEQALRVSAQESVVAQMMLTRFFNADELRRFDSSLQEAFWEAVKAEPSIGQEILSDARALNKTEGGLLRRGAAWIANGVKAVIGLAVAWLTFGFGMWDLLLFFPLGFIGGAYLITWLLYLKLRRRELAFKRQRVQLGRKIFEEVQVKPLFGSVDQNASRADVDLLAQRCQEISLQLRGADLD